MNTPAPPSQSQLHPSQPLHETYYKVTNQETSCVDQSSKFTVTDNEPSSVTKNQSPETSVVVDKLEPGEQVTQKVTPMEKKRRNRNGSSFGSPQSKVKKLLNLSFNGGFLFWLCA